MEAGPARAVPAAPDRDRHRVEGRRGRLSLADRADGYRDSPRGAAISSVWGTGPVRAGADSRADPSGIGGGPAAGPGGRAARALDAEKLEAVRAALAVGTSKAAVCRTFGIPRSTLYDTLERMGNVELGADK